MLCKVTNIDYMPLKNNLIPQLVEATFADYPTIQNMGRFYVYDLSRHCGLKTDHNWACPADGLYECIDLKKYFIENDSHSFLVKIDEELAGFVLIDKVGLKKTTEWNIGEFYIVAKFQGTGVAAQVLAKFFGKWEVSAIPENTPAVKFWRKTIAKVTSGNYQEDSKKVDYDDDQPNRIVFSFDSQNIKNMNFIKL